MTSKDLGSLEESWIANATRILLVWCKELGNNVVYVAFGSNCVELARKAFTVEGKRRSSNCTTG